MLLTLTEAMNLQKNRTTVRAITYKELQNCETDINTMMPVDVYENVMELVQAHEKYFGVIGTPVMEASHVRVQSVNGQQVIIKKNGQSNESDLLEEINKDSKEALEAERLAAKAAGIEPLMSYNDTIEVGVKYDRIQFKLPIGPDGENRDTIGYLYSLDQNKFIGVAGKTVQICNNMNVFSDDLIFQASPQTLEKAFTKFEQYFERYEKHSRFGDDCLDEMKERWLTMRQIDSIISRQHYIAAAAKFKDFSGFERVFDDGILKTAHYKVHNSEYDYVVDAKQGGGSVYQVYNCFTEALRDNNNTLLEYFPRHKATYDFFSTKLDGIINAGKTEILSLEDHMQNARAEWQIQTRNAERLAMTIAVDRSEYGIGDNGQLQ